MKRQGKTNWIDFPSDPLFLFLKIDLVREQQELPKRLQVCDQDNFVISNN